MNRDRFVQYDTEELAALVKEACGSVYLLDMHAFRTNIQRLLSAFRTHYPNTNAGYPYKTNYLAALCVEANKMELYAEVVSGAEYELACNYGVPRDRIIFNGPVKNESELELALLQGALINIDCFEEINTIRCICDRNQNQPLTVGLRCRFSLNDKNDSRFGFNAEDEQLETAFQQLNEIPNCSVTGLHCHFSIDRSPDSFRARTKTMLDLSDRLFVDEPPRYLDLGGGFIGETINVDNQHGISPSYLTYADQVAQQLRSRYGQDGSTELILEPGVGILADVMRFACQVVSIKQLADRSVAVTTGSTHNIRSAAGLVRNPPIVFQVHADGDNHNRASRHLDFVGYTCMEDDVLHHDYDGCLEVGDIVIFENVGAYCLVFKPPFIREMPPIVCYEDPQGGDWRWLRPRQSTGDMMINFGTPGD